MKRLWICQRVWLADATDHSESGLRPTAAAETSLGMSRVTANFRGRRVSNLILILGNIKQTKNNSHCHGANFSRRKNDSKEGLECMKMQEENMSYQLMVHLNKLYCCLYWEQFNCLNPDWVLAKRFEQTRFVKRKSWRRECCLSISWKLWLQPTRNWISDLNSN